ncbi:major facilitator superfamily domain-containing protein, partial [Kickxella alabastrina]|uniref:major facilitator superfamily domain-containing protein n=1 Tax=Kickxella alabastrina TaxID=61397 RepID=UPI00221E831C
ADISWIGTTMVFCMLSVSIFTGPLTDKLVFRLISLAGSFICSVALMLASFTSTVWQFVPTQGVMYGIGAGFIYSPSISLTSQWHKKNRSLAIGITVAGTGVGGMIVSEIAQRLMEAVGYNWTLRVLALMAFCMSGTAASFYKRRVPIPREGYPADSYWHSWTVCPRRDIYDLVLSPNSSIDAWSVRKASNKLAIYLSAGSTVGRIVSSYASIAFGSINSIFISYTLCSVLILVAMLAIKSMAAYIALAIIYGAISVSYVSVAPLMIAEMFGVQKVPTAMGIMNAWNSIGVLIGNPSQGAIYQHLDRPNSSFAGITIWGATSLFLAACSFVVLKAIVICGGPHRIWSKL